MLSATGFKICICDSGNTKMIIKKQIRIREESEKDLLINNV